MKIDMMAVDAYVGFDDKGAVTKLEPRDKPKRLGQVLDKLWPLLCHKVCDALVYSAKCRA